MAEKIRRKKNIIKTCVKVSESLRKKPPSSFLRSKHDGCDTWKTTQKSRLFVFSFNSMGLHLHTHKQTNTNQHIGVTIFKFRKKKLRNEFEISSMADPNFAPLSFSFSFFFYNFLCPRINFLWTKFSYTTEEIRAPVKSTCLLPKR